MRKRSVILLLLLFPFFCFAQNKDYKSFDKAVEYNNEGDIKKAIRFANKSLKNSPKWNQPNLLLASIYANNNEVDIAVNYLLEVYNEFHPNYLKGIEQIFNLYYSNGFYNEALFYGEKIIDSDKNKYSVNTDIDRNIKNCKFAIEAIKNPVSFNPKNLGKNINSKNEEYLPAISVDGKTLVYSRRYMKSNLLQEDLFISKKDQSNLWGLSEPYSSGLNTNGNEGAFSFSADMQMVVFTACDRDDVVGRCDLYLLIDDRTYNAGKVVNSKEWDSQGCFSPDGKYLYFVSSREGGYGGKDIWRSEIIKNRFSVPENLGPMINTKSDEMSPFMHPDNLTLYFASNGHIGMGDYDIYISRRKDVTSSWEEPINIGFPINTHNTENSLIVANDGKTAYYTSNKSGFGLEDIFTFDLPKNVQADKISEIELEIITQIKREEIVLRNVIFSSNSFEIEKSSFDELNELIVYLKKNPNVNIQIQGHTDNIGSEKDNLILSQERARVVFRYLSSKVSNKIAYKGYGESKPLFDNNSAKGRRLNRRTSFILQ